MSDAVVEKHRKFRTIQTLRQHLMQTESFLNQVANHNSRALTTEIQLDRVVTVFQHIPKAAGTSLHDALGAGLGLEAFHERRNGLGNWPASMLGRAQFFSGHFDTASLPLIPANNLRVVTMLRDPTDRLISLYRYLCSIHPSAGTVQQRNMNLIGLARSQEPAAFFAHPDLANHPTINNSQTRQLAGALDLKSWESYPAPSAPELTETDLDLAVQHLESMAGFALLEHQTRTVPALFADLGLTSISSLPHSNQTATNRGPLFEAAPNIEVTTKLQNALARHIEVDTELYRSAKQILNRRGTV